MIRRLLAVVLLVFTLGCEIKTDYQRNAEQALAQIYAKENMGYDLAIRISGTSTTSYNYELADFAEGKLTHYAVFFDADGSLRKVSNMQTFAIEETADGWNRYNLGKVTSYYVIDGEEAVKYDMDDNVQEVFEIADLPEAVGYLKAGLETETPNGALSAIGRGQ